MPEKEILRRIYQAIKPYTGTMLVAMLCMVLVAGFSASQAYMVKPLLDRIFFEHDRSTLNILPLILIAIFLGKGIFYYGYTVLLEKVGQGVVRDLRQKVYRHISRMPLSFFHRTATGELISRVVSDVTLIQYAVSRAVVGILKDLFQVLGLLGVVFYMNWQLASFSLLFLPLSLVPMAIFGRLHRRYSHQNQETMANVSTHLHETINGHRIVKAFGMETYEGDRFAGIVDRLYRIFIKEAKVRNFSHSLMEFLGGVFVAMVIWYGGRQVLNGHATPGTFFSFMTSLVMIYEPIKSLSDVNSALQQGMAAAARVFRLLDEEPEPRAGTDDIPLPPFEKELRVENLSFSYDGNDTVLNDISFTIKAGETIALVGPSGGGKSTLANLVPRFYEPTRGKILIDGHNLMDLDIKTLRDQIAMVTQETILFNDTVKNNIAYGDPERNMDEIRAAARAAYALDFIEDLPQGFNTVIGEFGARLSGGQRQRLSIARALLKDAPILILDEATSNLDTESEREVQKALENLMRDRTTLVIAHRLSTIRQANRIYVIKDGRIVEQGDHDTLMASGGVYQTLKKMQR